MSVIWKVYLASDLDGSLRSVINRLWPERAQRPMYRPYMKSNEGDVKLSSVGNESE